MNEKPDRNLTLKLPTLSSFLTVAVQFVEKAADAFGLGRDEALNLSLATEEIFSYLSREVCVGKPIEIECENGLYYTRVCFRLVAPALNLGGLNITSAVAADDETGLADMGLMLASRSVDRLSIIAETQNRICLSLEKEKAYPSIAAGDALPSPEAEDAIALATPDAEGLKQFAIRVSQTCPPPLCPPFFTYPGKVVDMVAGGAYRAVTAVTPKGDIAGGLLFCYRTDRIVQIFGPFVFAVSGAAEMAKMLLDACISKVARTRAVGMVSLNGLPEALEKHFEPLGALIHYLENGETLSRPCHYRLLHEDPGCTIWTHEDLQEQLEREYRRLVLAREIRVVRDLGESKTGVSIFSAELRRERAEAILRPLWPGADFAVNVERHTRFLGEDEVRNLFFELDLGVSWHAALIPALLANGFKAEIILPFAGQADLVIFQHHPG